ncbi:MAG: glycine--tRNA ligase subunit beta [Methylacidiphilales bacterium]|nr:glycine--tRNA ligase subunit beta [Candidatus Methylacidiphilales bacterium]
MKTSELIFELGCEELPPLILKELTEQWRSHIYIAMKTRGIALENIEIHIGARRFVLLAKKVPVMFPAHTEEIIGPQLQEGLALEEHYLLPACMGFAKKHGVAVTSLKAKHGRLVAVKYNKPMNTTKLLAEGLLHSLTALSFPRTMRWGEYTPVGSTGEKEFIRPVRSAMFIFEKKPQRFSFFGVISSNKSFGHHFQSPASFTVTTIASYLQGLKKRQVVLSSSDRLRVIINALTKHKTTAPQRLLDEIVSMVEFPKVVVGEFDKKYLSLPEELRTEVLQAHQRYIPIPNSNKFCIVLNGNFGQKDCRVIVLGNERVVRPRLSDAEFFLSKDKKNIERLIGQSKENSKVKRMVALFPFLPPSFLTAVTELDIALVKADLASATVGEFPHLQGVISSYLFNRPEFKQSYKPLSDTDTLPEHATSCYLSFIDKYDELTYLAGQNQLATSEADPYGTRRLAIGIVKLLSEGHQHSLLHTISLLGLLQKHLGNEQGMSLYRFIVDKHNQYLKRNNKVSLVALPEHKVFSTQLGLSYFSIVQLATSLTSVFIGFPQLESLKSSHKRLRNITKQNEIPITTPPESVVATLQMFETMLTNDEHDMSLYELFLTLMKGEESYIKHLHRMANLCEPLLASYFEKVFVMCGGEKQQARLTLLASLRWLIEREVHLDKL